MCDVNVVIFKEEILCWVVVGCALNKGYENKLYWVF